MSILLCVYLKILLRFRLLYAHIETFECSWQDFSVFTSGFYWVQVQKFLRSWPYFCAFMSRFSYAQVKILVSLCSDSSASMVALFWVQIQCLARSLMSRSSYIQVQSFVLSCSLFQAFISRFLFMSRLQCFHFLNSVLSSALFNAFMSKIWTNHIQKLVLSCSDYYVLISRLLFVHLYTFVHSCQDFCVCLCADINAIMSKVLYAHFEISKCPYSGFMFSSPDFNAFIFTLLWVQLRTSCVHVNIFLPSYQDFFALRSRFCAWMFRF